jgi:hypothetical protein
MNSSSPRRRRLVPSGSRSPRMRLSYPSVIWKAGTSNNDGGRGRLRRSRHRRCRREVVETPHHEFLTKQLNLDEHGVAVCSEECKQLDAYARLLQCGSARQSKTVTD